MAQEDDGTGASTMSTNNLYQQGNNHLMDSVKDSNLNKVADLILEFADVNIQDCSAAANNNHGTSIAAPCNDVHPTQYSVESQRPPRCPATNIDNQDDTSQVAHSPSKSSPNTAPDLLIPQSEQGASSVAPWSKGSEARAAPLCRQSNAGPQPGRENIEPLSDLVLYDLSERLSAQPQQQRKLALRLGMKEEQIGPIIYRNEKDIIMQYYEILRTYYRQCEDERQALEGLIAAIKILGQKGAADWLIKRTGSILGKEEREEREACLEGDGSKGVVIPSVSELTSGCGSGGRGDSSEDLRPSQFYDIFFVASKETKKYERANIDRLRDIFQRHPEWKVFEHGCDERLGVPQMESIENILRVSSHLVVAYSAADEKYTKDAKTNMIIEMAFHKAFNDMNLVGKIIPVSCCRQVDLPLCLQALTGTHIGDEYFERKLARSIDLRVRKEREQRN